MDHFEKALVDGAATAGVQLGDREVSLMKRHALHVREYNEKVNLTEITSPEQMAIKHYVDSLACAHLIPNGALLVDVGSGAGFPGIPLAILRPDLKVTLLDAVQKKTTFLGETVAMLGINATVVHARTEDYGRAAGRERFDVAIARAVAKSNILAEYCLPLVKVGGTFLAMKGPSVDAELESARNGINSLGGNVEGIFEFELPGGFGDRRVVIIKKHMATPRHYPRRAGLPEKKPL